MNAGGDDPEDNANGSAEEEIIDVSRPDELAQLRWVDLEPEPGIVAALDHAGPRPTDGTDTDKNNWSNRFANACAVALAGALRTSSKEVRQKLRRKTILPISLAEGTEPLTPIGSGTKKRIDVTITDPVLGLEVGISLKGLNFRDKSGNNYDKNLTGRTYELIDEVRHVHEHLPHCYMVGIYLLPLASTDDKRSTRSPSSFARSVVMLRGRSGRIDVSLAGQASRCDASYVGLYARGDDGATRGAVRFFSTDDAPPKRGRPRVQDTLSLHELVAEIVGKVTHSVIEEWGTAENPQS